MFQLIIEVYLLENSREKLQMVYVNYVEKKLHLMINKVLPYLEVHHIKILSHGGSDSVENVVALCPNCHKKIHLLELEDDINKIQQKELANLN